MWYLCGRGDLMDEHIMRYHEGLAIFSNTDIYWHSMMILWFPQCFLLKLSSLYVPILFQLCSIHISPMPCTYSRPCGINKLWTMAPWGQQWHGEVEMRKISTGCLACIDFFLCLMASFVEEADIGQGDIIKLEINLNAAPLCPIPSLLCQTSLLESFRCLLGNF